MVQSATALIRPTGEQPNEEMAASRATPPALAPNPEDHRLAERVERALRATGYGALCTLRVSVHARAITLGGRVSSYYLKQVAQATVVAVSGAHEIRNELDVVRPVSDRQNALQSSCG